MGEGVRGASTISMQLARNLYNEEIGKSRELSRKLKEMVTAVHLERRYTKAEIAEMYLNTVEFGSNAFGIEAAARTFFGKHPMDLNVLESATLIGMLKATTSYNPLVNPERSRERRNTVLGQMLKHGHISDDFYEENKGEPVNASFHSSAVTASVAPHFAEHVRLWLEDWGGE